VGKGGKGIKSAQMVVRLGKGRLGGKREPTFNERNNTYNDITSHEEGKHDVTPKKGEGKDRREKKVVITL